MLDAFPAPKFRKYQKETLKAMANAFNSGYKAILLEAPTGAGKSILNATFCSLWKSFYTTPQLALIDQIRRDKYIRDCFVEIKGRQNYDCYYDPAATCDVGICRRIPNYKCDRFMVCPYYQQKAKALAASSALMSFAYFMLEGRTQTEYSFGNRDLLVLDESHSLDQHIINHIDLTISPYSMPVEVYRDVAGLIQGGLRTLGEVKALVSTVLEAVTGEQDQYVQLNMMGEELSREQAKSNNKLESWKMNAERFLETCDLTEWVWQDGWVTYRGNSYKTYVVQPLYARFFAKEMIWSRANKYIVSSATILDPRNFAHQTGLDRVLKGSEIKHIRVPSVFPVENRPVIDTVDGKLTYKYKEDNMGWAVKILEALLDEEEGKNVAVHCVSYSNASEIAARLDSRFDERLIVQTPETRKEDLEDFQNSKGKVFLCVAFTEGVDWIGEKCEAQVLFKVPYMNISDRRVGRRLEKKDWRWYRLEALKQVIQAYGRAVRSETDKAKFYVIDQSFIDLLKRTRRSMPNWFTEALPEKWKKLVR